MPKLQLKNRDKTGKSVNAGCIEIANHTNEQADIYFFGDICSESWQSEWYAEDKCPKDVEEFLKDVDGVATLNIHINSGGGSVFGGIAIYNLLKRHPANKIVYVDGVAASIASVIAMAGDKIIVPKNAQLMVHKPWCYAAGDANDMKKTAEMLDTCQKSILATYMTKAREGVTEDAINALIENETWLTGDKASEYFNISLEESCNAAACESTFFDIYKNIPEDLKKEKASADELVDTVAKKVLEIVESNIATKQAAAQENEERKKAILADLDLI